MAVSASSHQNLATDGQESSNADSAPTPHSPRQPSTNPTPYMAQSDHDSTWLPQALCPTSEQDQHAMLTNADLSWTAGGYDADAEALFPGLSNYAFSQQSLSPQTKSGMPSGLHYDSYLALQDQGFEAWNENANLTHQPRSFPEPSFDDREAVSQFSSQAFPPSAFQYPQSLAETPTQHGDELAGAMPMDIHTSVERPPGSTTPAQQGQNPQLYGLGVSMDYHHSAYSTKAHSPTPMLSDFSGGDRDDFFDLDDDDNEKPYATLIWQALLTAQDHSMQLQDIYDWIQNRTDKVKDKSGQGWRNSIRHNLSMNKAFEKTTPENKSKKGGKNTWRLVDKFVQGGPESTTRYRRKEPNFKRPRKSAHPAPQRQASGAKGGQAARKAAEQRRSARLREAGANASLFCPPNQHEHDDPRLHHGLPYYSSSPAMSHAASPLYCTGPNSPYPEPHAAFSQSLPMSYATVPSPEQFLKYQQQSLAAHAKDQQHEFQYAFESPFDRPFAAAAPYTPSPHDASSTANSPTPGGWPDCALVDSIAFADLGERPLFAPASCDGSDSASELNFPATPSPMGSAIEGYPGLGAGVDPSPFGIKSGSLFTSNGRILS